VNPSIELPHASTDPVHDSADTPPWPGIPGIGDMIGQNNLACAKPIDFELPGARPGAYCEKSVVSPHDDCASVSRRMGRSCRYGHCHDHSRADAGESQTSGYWRDLKVAFGEHRQYGATSGDIRFSMAKRKKPPPRREAAFD
jgi:hypothetical protein